MVSLEERKQALYDAGIDEAEVDHVLYGVEEAALSLFNKHGIELTNQADVITTIQRGALGVTFEFADNLDTSVEAQFELLARDVLEEDMERAETSIEFVLGWITGHDEIENPPEIRALSDSILNSHYTE